MKTIENEPNISRHENGNLYYVARKGGKLTVKSLKTTNLAEARRKIREMGTLALTAKREPEPPAVVLPVPLPAALVETKTNGTDDVARGGIGGTSPGTGAAVERDGKDGGSREQGG